MSDELLYFLIVFADLALALAAFSRGKEWVYVFITTNLLLVAIFSGVVVNLFGFNTTVAGPFYASIFLATDALTEHYGRKEGHRSIAMGLGAQISFLLFAFLALNISSVEFTSDLHSALEMAFNTSARIVFASALAYFIAQNFDVWFFHYLKSVTDGKLLWLRNNLSTIASQTIDGIIFFSVAFYGVLPNWLEVAIVGTIAKVLVALLDTPFLYATRIIKK